MIQIVPHKQHKVFPLERKIIQYSKRKQSPFIGRQKHLNTLSEQNTEF